ncbi:MAG TPA: MBOAT family O-acyltransferase [Burkholderiales bacterium]|nr:MBOAT family O-acyltransferase [Burkholderiales bacterium]
MLFNQYLFIAFFAAVAAGNFALRRFPLAQKLLLIAASFVFFLSWGGADVLLFAAMLAANYPIACAIHAAAGRRRATLAAVAVAGNLAVLAYFKYSNFFIGAVVGALLPPAAVWAPLGLSFYVFHLLSYHVDVHRRLCAPGAFIDYVAYLSFFPHLIAGPIVRCAQLMPQFAAPPSAGRFDWAAGVQLFAIGFFLKCAADLIGAATDADWTSQGVVRLSSADAWATAVLFSCRIFGDFAGYSYMALGMARMLGYALPVNFNAPYLAASFREFWQRWHITLSRFLRDYLYVLALGGNRSGWLRTQLNTLLTMLLGGLWHGANWTFVAWGGLHGLALVVERWLGFDRPAARSWILRAAWFVVVQLTVVLAWVLFRSPDLQTASVMLHKMVLFADWRPLDALHRDALVLVLPVAGYHLARLAGERGLRLHPNAAGALSACLLAFGLVLLTRPTTFLYFEF